MYALDSENEKFEELINQIAQNVSIDIFESFDELLDATVEGCSGILLDYDNETRKREKQIKAIKKHDSEIPIFLLANSLDTKKLSKHQNSKTGAHLYFQTPIDNEMIFSMLDPFFEFDEDEPANVEEKVIQEHTQTKDVSSAVQDVSDKIDGAMSGVFFDEYSNEEEVTSTSVEESMPSLDPLDEISLDSSDDVGIDSEDTGEFSLEDTNADVSIDESGDNELLSLDSEDSNEVDDLGINLDGASTEDSSWSENEELSMTDNEEDLPEKYPSDEDLTFPDLAESVDMSALDDNSSQNAQEKSSGLEELDLGEQEDSTELSLSEEESVDFQSSEDDVSPALGELDLGAESDLGGLDLGESTGEFSMDDSSENADEISLGGDDSESKLFDLSESEESEENEVNLGSESISEASSEIQTGMNSISGLDEEIVESDVEFDENELTMPSMALSDSGLNVSVPTGEFKNQDEEDIDSLLADSNESVDSASSLSVEGGGADEDATIVGVKIEEAIAKSSDLEVNEELSSINIDSELTSVNLPQEVPTFSDELQTRLNNIDNLIKSGTSINEIEEIEEDIYEEDSEDEPTVVQRLSKIEDETKTKVQLKEPVDSDLRSEHREYVQSHDEELIRLSETIKSLREDRERLLERVHTLENQKEMFDENILNIKAELDEKKIENVIIKKRMDKQTDDLKFQLDLANDKKDLLNKQKQDLIKEVELLSKQRKINMNTVHSRERELEERLELLKRDAEVQIKNREKIILELKRRIDTLEFDIENSHFKEQKSINSQIELEDKMNKVIKTLRGAIGQLEDDYELEARKKMIKKNLDV